jgi:magnesium-protoporphyrin IX monomethyl ester (oxidative) cyclase
MRPEFHKALGVDIDWYDQEVFRKTSAIARQIFPVELDIDHPRWLPNLRRMEAAFDAGDGMRRAQGRHRRLAQSKWGRRGPGGLCRLYLIPVKRTRLPASVRLEPAY